MKVARVRMKGQDFDTYVKPNYARKYEKVTETRAIRMPENFAMFAPYGKFKGRKGDYIVFHENYPVLVKQKEFERNYKPNVRVFDYFEYIPNEMYSFIFKFDRVGAFIRLAQDYPGITTEGMNKVFLSLIHI